MFAARLAECGAALAPYVDWDLARGAGRGGRAAGLDRADVVQPALWAVMVSLAAVWQAAGVTPDAVVGHRQGEIAAATVAGILSLEDAARVVALRSQALAGAGRARAGWCRWPSPRPRSGSGSPRWGGRLSVAAVNGPAATVVSGEPEALAELVAACEAAGVRARRAAGGLRLAQRRRWSRSGTEILAALAGVAPGPARVPMFSAMTGRVAGRAGGWTPGTGTTACARRCEFDRAVRALAAAGHRVFVEVSPHPVLTAAIDRDRCEDAAPADARRRW